jgi:hypothetical protein
MTCILAIFIISKKFSKFNLKRNLFGEGTLHERSKNERQPYSIIMSVYEKEVFWSHLFFHEVYLHQIDFFLN